MRHRLRGPRDGDQAVPATAEAKPIVMARPPTDMRAARATIDAPSDRGGLT